MRSRSMLTTLTLLLLLGYIRNGAFAQCTANLKMFNPPNGATVTLNPTHSGVWTQWWEVSIVHGDTCTGTHTLHGILTANGKSYNLGTNTQPYVLSTGAMAQIATWAEVSYATLTPQTITISMWTSTASLNNVKRNAVDDGIVIGSVIITTADTKSPTRSTISPTAPIPAVDASSPTVFYPSTVALETGSQTSLSTTATSDEYAQGGFSKSTLAGVIGGIAGGFLLLGATIILICSRLYKKSEKVKQRDPDPDEYITLSGNLGKNI